ncbi:MULTISPECIES: GntR family transcriptional regulator [Paraburkholderia]|jgi:DNA-binding GntR family transcriptional regulator|uniref:GntR family transcriptional regulator n=1 Tax=Paraburkholderia hospita TaxID=169430 RepID=A0AAJ4SZV0_9BURK|nr:GntR family transcriptional regulator [Paraburkholderia hospita]SKC74818.1 transcriptional regulator, GntR family [Burkholderia sp. CF099]SOE48185.1 transcriptional regulator, GntR family [Burkholderia sp. YR290]AUT68071.1 GntR family transcriptional regulator [Paraburkholderia hospita]AXE98204.1 GntR family transcriptional regulator [Paraburkholderia hospita]OUL71605.1 GntR family transcriptional regulator [Paraburkholderia hospita]
MSDTHNVTASSTKPEAIAERIRAAILEHRLAPGAKLTEAQLCEVFGVKRGPIRQALALLSTDHLVDLEPNRGAFVASPSLQEVHEVFEMRRIIELAVVDKICASQGSRRLKNIGGMIARERKAFESRDFPAWIRLSGEFHTELASLTGNTVLCDCLNGLVARSTLISALYESLGRSPCSFEDHEAILAALDSGDAKTAGALMSRHLQSVELKMLDRPASGGTDLHEVFGMRAPRAAAG